MPPYRKLEVEYRDQLFNAEETFARVQEEVTPATVRALREIGKPYAFGIDRQSEGKAALADPDQTGHKGRVRTILRAAERFGLYLPEPIERPNQRKGETPFLFDTRFWYVDGEDDRSTGFSFSPEIRPRLWRAYATIRRINEIDPAAAPKALVLAEYDRFLRADEWIKVWVNALWKEGVDVIFPESGPVQNMHLEMICITVRARSEHLKGYRERFLEVAKRDHRIPYGKEPYGLQFSSDRRSVFTRPEQWEVMYEVLHQLADGRLKNASHAARWSRDTYGEERAVSHALIRKWFGEHIEILHSRYVTNRYRQKPCVVKQTSGMLYDYSYTKRRNKRYIRQELPREEWVWFEVDHDRNGTKPIPPNVIEAARLRATQVGRPATKPPTPATAECIAPARLVRCAHCKGRVKETFRASVAGKPDTKWHGWCLSCQGYKVKAELKSMTAREAKSTEPAHSRTLAGWTLTLPLREALKHWLAVEVNPVAHYDSGDVDVAGERVALERHRAALQERLTTMLSNMGSVSLPPAAVEVMNRQLADIQGQIDDCDREQQILDARLLNSAATNTAALELREQFQKGFARMGDDPVFWRAVVEGVVERIDIDLDAKVWVAHMHLRVPTLKQLQGELADTRETGTGGATNSTSPARYPNLRWRDVRATLTGQLARAA